MQPNGVGRDATAQHPPTGWTDPECPVARTADLIGDRWSLLLIRDAMDGARTFTEFQRRTGIARNILTDRLRKLVARGILLAQPAGSGRRHTYTLTVAGHDLFPVIVGLRQWGERYAFTPGEPCSTLRDDTGRAPAELIVVDVDGDRLTDQDTAVQRP